MSTFYTGRVILKCPRCGWGWEMKHFKPKAECPKCQYFFTINEDNAPAIVSFSPKVAMDPAVRYTTQSSKYDALLVGRPLTDRRIAHYQRLRAAAQLGVAPKNVRKILNRKEKQKRLNEMERLFK